MRLGGLGTLVVAVVGALALSGGPAMAAPSSTPVAYTCTGGDFQTGTLVPIPSGIYASITVKGACQTVPHAEITVVGDVNVAAGAVLDAQSYPSTITVGHDVTAGPGSLLGLGCLPDPVGHTTGHPCVDDPLTASSSITIDGNVTASDANAVLLNGITVKGNVTLIGSEGTATAAERHTAIPWAVKTNTIGGDLIVSDMTPLWLGVLLNNVGGSVILTNVSITDGLPTDPLTKPGDVDTTPTIYVASNRIEQNLVCSGLGPYLFAGSPGEVNLVRGQGIGQCDGPGSEHP
jgi:hypothetical protein